MASGDIGLLEYIASLTELERKLEKDLYETKIARAHAERTMREHGTRATLPKSDTPRTEDAPKIISRPYAGRGVEESALKHLLSVGRPQKTAQVRNALLEGGIKTKAKSFDATVFGSLKRLEEKGKVKKVGTGQWQAVQPNEQGLLSNIG